MSTLKISPLSHAPSLYLINGLCRPQTLDYLLKSIHDPQWLSAHQRYEDETHGLAYELDTSEDETLAALASDVRLIAGYPEGELSYLRLRFTQAGQGHPPHHDTYDDGQQRLVATVLITLSSPDEGGQTSFPRAQPEPVQLAPAPGDALLWFNLDEHGQQDELAWHEGLAVISGQKITLGCFIYASTQALERHANENDAPTLHLIVDEPGSELEAQLMQAAAALGVRAQRCCAADFAMEAPPLLPAGDMLYRIGTSHTAQVVEQLLIHDLIATFYQHPAGAHIIWDNQSLLLAKHGVPTPRTIHALDPNSERLRAQVEALGGLPVILKLPGRSLGQGVMRLDTWVSLISVAEAIYGSHGATASLMSYIEDAVHWRIIVVGRSVAASYINETRPGDFRTWADEDNEAHFNTAPPAAASTAALSACQALELELGGVDVLVHPSGRAYVLEVNFPCYFGHPKRAGSGDVAAVMVAHLLAKRAALIAQLEA